MHQIWKEKRKSASFIIRIKEHEMHTIYYRDES